MNPIKSIEKLQNTSLDGCTISQITHRINLPETSVRNICEQLKMLDLIDITSVNRESDGYKLTKKTHALSPISFLESSKKVGGDSAGLLEWDSKAIAWHSCAYPSGKSCCGDSPCNEFQGLYYCKEHFLEAQKKMQTNLAN